MPVPAATEATSTQVTQALSCSQSSPRVACTGLVCLNATVEAVDAGLLAGASVGVMVLWGDGADNRTA
jgi:hypothetical protein